jgi:NifU-like protein
MQSDSEVVRDHFSHPRNVGDAGEPSFTGRAASLACGATLCFSIQIDESQRISQAKFKAAGCSLLVASLSLLTEQVKGKSTAEAAAIGKSPDVVGVQLGPIGQGLTQCLRLACDALLDAIREYSDAARDEWNGEEALICTCFCVSERTIEREIQQKALTSIAEVTRACNAGGGCGSCHQLIEEMLYGPQTNDLSR